jgi:hypothetical protein
MANIFIHKKHPRTLLLSVEQLTVFIKNVKTLQEEENGNGDGSTSGNINKNTLSLRRLEAATILFVCCTRGYEGNSNCISVRVEPPNPHSTNHTYPLQSLLTPAHALNPFRQRHP